MSKSYVSRFLDAYRNIFQDISANYPNLRRGFDRDMSRLKSASERLGESFFTIHLPAARKILDRAVSQGSLSPLDSIPFMGRINGRTLVPKLFSGLWLELFSVDGVLKQGADPNILLYLRTAFSLLKKLEGECSRSAAYAAVKEYYEIDTGLPEGASLWDSDGSFDHDLRGYSLTDLSGVPTGGLFDGCDNPELPLLALAQQIADRASTLLGEFIPGEWPFKHGPGATSEIPRGRGYKYLFPGWSRRLQRVFPGELFAIANPSILGEDFSIDSLCASSEAHARLIEVPKTYEAPRLIAAEPTCHQWCQQSIANFLAVRISQTHLGRSIDFRRQDLSRSLALSSSKDGKLATIDLKSASDRISCQVIERVFRLNRPLLEAMIVCRTRFIENRIDKKQPRLHKLRKFSTMGSALTFPVQSLLFYILTVTAGLTVDYGGKAKFWREAGDQVRVYGDDIIAPVAWVPTIERLLSLCHLRVNRNKTFSEGNFRESCGCDAFMGYDVTPLYVTQVDHGRSPTSAAAIRDIANNAFLKGFWHVSRWAEQLLPGRLRKELPTVGVKAADIRGPARALSVPYGLVSFCGTRPAKVRWNEDLQEEQYRASIVFDGARGSRSEGPANLLQYFTEEPAGTQVNEWSSGVFGRSDPRHRLGWVSAALF